METVHCNLCGSQYAERIHQMPDWSLGRNEVLFTYVRCADCGLVFQNPRPTEEEISQYYPDEYECYPAGGVKKTNSLMRRAVAYGMKRRFSHIEKHRKSGRLLDLGCATGLFLESVREMTGKNGSAAWNFQGVEISPFAAEIARQKGLNVITGQLQNAGFPDESFDAVTLWDVFEHLHDPSKDLSEIYRIMKPGGILVMRIPNLDSWDAKIFGKYWAGYEPPRHLHVFGVKTIGQMLERGGFHLLEMDTKSSRHLVFTMSLRFYLTGIGTKPTTIERVIRLLNSPAARLILVPLFFFYGMGMRGPLLTLTVEKPPKNLP